MKKSQPLVSRHSPAKFLKNFLLLGSNARLLCTYIGCMKCKTSRCPEGSPIRGYPRLSAVIHGYPRFDSSLGLTSRHPELLRATSTYSELFRPSTHMTQIRLRRRGCPVRIGPFRNPKSKIKNFTRVSLSKVNPPSAPKTRKAKQA
jgi:hypothetical protein